MLRQVLWLAIAAASPLPALAAPQDDTRILIADLSGETPLLVSFDWRDLTPSFDLSKACENGPEGAQKIRECAACSASRHSTRWISSRGSEIHVFVIFMGRDDTVPEIQFTEEKRRSRLATDLATAMKLAKALALTARVEDPTLRCAARSYRLQHTRAHLRVSAAVPDLLTEATDKPSNRTGATTLTTGPVEHLYLSADLPVRRLNDVKLADDGLEPVTKPTKFFIGINYALGDLSDDRPKPWRRELIDNLVARVMAEASRTPLDSFGVALAFRGSYLRSFGLDFDTVSPFVGYLWTRSEEGSGDRLTGTVQFGFSVNLDKALGWVQGDK